MSVRRKRIFNGTLSSSQINQSQVFNEADIVLLVVGGLEDGEFIEMAGSVNLRVRQGSTLDPCDDPIALPDFIVQNIPGGLLPPATRELFDMGDYEYPLNISNFNSYAVVPLQREVTELVFDMTVCLIPSFDIQCEVWVLWQEKNTRNLSRQVCANNAASNLQFAALAANQVVQNQALAFATLGVGALAAPLTGGTSLAAAGVIAAQLGAVSIPLGLLAAPSAIPLLPG